MSLLLPRASGVVHVPELLRFTDPVDSSAALRVSVARVVLSLEGGGAFSFSRCLSSSFPSGCSRYTPTRPLSGRTFTVFLSELSKGNFVRNGKPLPPPLFMVLRVKVTISTRKGISLPPGWMLALSMKLLSLRERTEVGREGRQISSRLDCRLRGRWNPSNPLGWMLSKNPGLGHLGGSVG